MGFILGFHDIIATSGPSIKAKPLITLTKKTIIVLRFVRNNKIL